MISSRAIRSLALGGAVLAFAALPAAPAVAAPSLASCQQWYDHAGPGHAGRAHAKCGGVYVQVTVYCADGSQSTSVWRWGYSKAECPYGTDYRYATVHTRH